MTQEPDTPLELEITSLSSEGDGIARDASGRVVFVPFTAPGDRVLARVVTRKRRFLRAEVVRVCTPGADRVEAPCSVYGECGGCSWQHVAYPAQLEQKRLQLRAAFERIARVAPPEIEITPSSHPYGYRTRARVLREPEGAGYRQRRSRALCAVERCPVLDPALEPALAQLAADQEAVEGEWELAVGCDAARSWPLGARDAGADERITLELLGDRLEISPGVFFQANTGLHEPIAQAVLSAAGEGALALDLYAGAGFFTLGLAQRFERVVAVESHAPAARDCRRNLERAGRENALVLHGTLEKRHGENPLASLRPETVVLDPPRAGVDTQVLAWLGGLGAERIVYLSCDPATLARDTARLCERGYSLTALRAFDLFPQTPHVEALAVLRLAAA